MNKMNVETITEENIGLRCACCGKEITKDQGIFYNGTFNIYEKTCGFQMKIVKSCICKDCAQKNYNDIISYMMQRVGNDEIGVIK